MLQVCELKSAYRGVCWFQGFDGKPQGRAFKQDLMLSLR